MLACSCWTRCPTAAGCQRRGAATTAGEQCPRLLHLLVRFSAPLPTKLPGRYRHYFSVLTPSVQARRRLFQISAVNRFLSPELSDSSSFLCPGPFTLELFPSASLGSYAVADTRRRVGVFSWPFFIPRHNAIVLFSFSTALSWSGYWTILL